MKTEPNQRAYPGSDLHMHNGLTKRELFAAMAMQGLAANPELHTLPYKSLAGYSVNMADALIAALNKDVK